MHKLRVTKFWGLWELRFHDENERVHDTCIVLENWCCHFW